jgi:5-methylcytosine-specific restriction endonuclease McrA
MKIKSIKSHLKPYLIFWRRKTTISHAFASAVAPYDIYDEKVIRKAVKTLGQNPDKNLLCVYCGKLAETWDHVVGLVKNSEFSGYGHVIGNLVPCCRNCNFKKGNKNWKIFLNQKSNSIKRIKVLSKYFSKYLKVVRIYNPRKDVNFIKLSRIKNEIFRLMQKADVIAVKIKQKI